MKRILWPALVLGLAVTACMSTRQDAPADLSSSRSALTGDASTPCPTQLPPIQRSINLRTWRWGERFYPTDVASAYTVVVTSPVGFPGSFVAYGFDVARGTTPFAVAGPLSERERFEAAIQQEMRTVPRQQAGVISFLLTLEPGPAGDGGTPDGGVSDEDGGVRPEAPPIGKNEETGDPNVDEELFGWPAFDIAVAHHRAVVKGTLKPKAVEIKLGK